jgi:p-cumate 2,3-dioxygenase alpha subunit
MAAAQPNPLVVDDRERGIFRVHRSAMTSQEVFERERKEIFEKVWLYVGHESEISKPGDFRRRNIAGRPIIFIHGADGEIRALFNACTHRGATICRQDAGNARIFQCFYHAWTFDTKGDLVQVPDEEGYSECFDKSERGLRAPVKFDNYRGFYFLSYNPDVEDLETYLAGAAEYLDLVADQSADGMNILAGTNLYSMNANWKLLVENSLDGYHGVPVHSTYFDYLASYGEGGDPIPEGVTDSAVDLGNGHTVIEWPTPYGRPVAHWHQLFGEESREEIAEIEAEVVSRVGEERGFRICHMGKNLLIFPNLVIVDGTGVTVRTFEPLAPDRIEISAWSLGPARETPAQIARRVDSYVTFLGPGGFATPDDVEALESCQEGFRTYRELEYSDISRGMARKPSMFDELQMRTFWRTWFARVEGNELPAQVTEIETQERAAVSG